MFTFIARFYNARMRIKILTLLCPKYQKYLEMLDINWLKYNSAKLSINIFCNVTKMCTDNNFVSV